MGNETKQQHKDSARSKNNAQSIKAAQSWQDPDVRRRRSEAIRAALRLRMQDPKVRERTIATLKRPDVAAARVAACKTPEYRARARAYALLVGRTPPRPDPKYLPAELLARVAGA